MQLVNYPPDLFPLLVPAWIESVVIAIWWGGENGCLPWGSVGADAYLYSIGCATLKGDESLY